MRSTWNFSPSLIPAVLHNWCGAGIFLTWSSHLRLQWLYVCPVHCMLKSAFGGKEGRGSSSHQSQAQDTWRVIYSVRSRICEPFSLSYEAQAYLTISVLESEAKEKNVRERGEKHSPAPMERHEPMNDISMNAQNSGLASDLLFHLKEKIGCISHVFSFLVKLLGRGQGEPLQISHLIWAELQEKKNM